MEKRSMMIFSQKGRRYTKMWKSKTDMAQAKIMVKEVRVPRLPVQKGEQQYDWKLHRKEADQECSPWCWVNELVGLYPECTGKPPKDCSGRMTWLSIIQGKKKRLRLHAPSLYFLLLICSVGNVRKNWIAPTCIVCFLPQTKLLSSDLTRKWFCGVNVIIVRVLLYLIISAPLRWLSQLCLFWIVTLLGFTTSCSRVWKEKTTVWRATSSTTRHVCSRLLEE